MKNKEEIIRLMKEYAFKYPEEEEKVSRCVNLLEKYNDNRVFYRDCFDDGHFTGSVVVLNPEKDKILLMHHKKFGTWQQFGGHVDGKINIRNEAIRELEEEAGISKNDIEVSQGLFHFAIHDVPTHANEPSHYHYDVTYFAIVNEDTPFKIQEEEVYGIAWFHIEEVITDLGKGKFSSGFESIFKKINSGDV